MSVAKVSEISATSSKSFEDCDPARDHQVRENAAKFRGAWVRSSTCAAPMPRHGYQVNMM